MRNLMKFCNDRSKRGRKAHPLTRIAATEKSKTATPPHTPASSPGKASSLQARAERGPALHNGTRPFTYRWNRDAPSPGRGRFSRTCGDGNRARTESPGGSAAGEPPPVAAAGGTLKRRLRRGASPSTLESGEDYGNTPPSFPCSRAIFRRGYLDPLVYQFKPQTMKKFCYLNASFSCPSRPKTCLALLNSDIGSRQVINSQSG
ncbi:uncharacterized protein LOC123579287 [Leopardus geoffroyi]|uniref:uncharacterized protein LOC123579287 n=1 Tax=Leopardus geoffroyi TaxID=46844 RepID=UPI001E2604A8|nr:uncharacterized protein LOC123579287 [Leopardus geoffroyi]